MKTVKMSTYLKLNSPASFEKLIDGITKLPNGTFGPATAMQRREVTRPATLGITIEPFHIEVRGHLQLAHHPEDLMHLVRVYEDGTIERI